MTNRRSTGQFRAALCRMRRYGWLVALLAAAASSAAGQELRLVPLFPIGVVADAAERLALGARQPAPAPLPARGVAAPGRSALGLLLIMTPGTVAGVGGPVGLAGSRIDQPEGAAAARPAPGAAPPAEELARQLEELRETVAAQQREIGRLREADRAPPDWGVMARDAWRRLAESWDWLIAFLADQLTRVRAGAAELGPTRVVAAGGIVLLIVLLGLLSTRRQRREAREIRQLLRLPRPVSARFDAVGDRVLIEPEFLAKAIHSFEPARRRKLAQMMATRADAPRDLMVVLACDEFEIAEPVLRDSEALDDPLLLDLIARLSSQHQRAVALRCNLSPAVAEALVKTDKVDVIAALLRNRHARIAETTMETVVEASRHVDTYREPLARRPDLSPGLAFRLAEWAPEPIKRQMREKFSVSQVDAAPAAHPVAEAAPEATLAAKVDGREPRQMAAPPPVTAQRLVDALRDGDLDRFEQLLGDVTGLGVPSLHQILDDRNGTGLAVLCRALDIEPSRFASLFLLIRRLTPGGRPAAPEDLARAVAAHEGLSAASARERLAEWQRRASAMAGQPAA